MTKRITLVHEDLRLTNFARKVSEVLNSSISKNVTEIVWDTSGEGTAETWEDVYAIVQNSKLPCSITLKRRPTDPQFNIPTSLYPYEMNYCTFYSPFGTVEYYTINIEDGAQLKNVKYFEGSMLIVGNSSSIPCLNNTNPLLPADEACVYCLKTAVLVNNGTSPMISTSTPTVVVFCLAGGFNIGNPIFKLSVDEFLWLQFMDGGFFNIDPGFIEGVNSSTLLISHNGGLSASSDISSGITIPTFPGMLGTVINGPFGTNGGSGPSASAAGISGRPSDSVSKLTIGCSYFDTDLGKPIWFDGLQWVYSDGTPV